MGAANDNGDLVKNPSHYRIPAQVVSVNGIDHVECWDVIRSLGLSYAVGNVFKYLWRAGRKQGNSALMDLKKAKQYLDDEIAHIEAN